MVETSLRADNPVKMVTLFSANCQISSDKAALRRLKFVLKTRQSEMKGNVFSDV